MSSNNDDLSKVWCYLATLQLTTPLAYLESNGKYSPGSKETPLVGPLTSLLEDGTGFNSFAMSLY